MHAKGQLCVDLDVWLCECLYPCREYICESKGICTYMLCLCPCVSVSSCPCVQVYWHTNSGDQLQSGPTLLSHGLLRVGEVGSSIHTPCCGKHGCTICRCMHSAHHRRPQHTGDVLETRSLPSSSFSLEIWPVSKFCPFPPSVSQFVHSPLCPLSGRQ